MKSLRVAMIGYGFMGAAHSQGWRTAPRVFDLPADAEMAVIVGRDGAAVAKAGRKWGWAESATDWREVIARDDIDVVDIVTPGESHAEIAIAALDAGKHVYQEKTMAFTVDHAKRMRAAYNRAGKRIVQIGHQSCSSGHVQDAAQFASGDKLGTVNFETSCLPATRPDFSRAMALMFFRWRRRLRQ